MHAKWVFNYAFPQIGDFNPFDFFFLPFALLSSRKRWRNRILSLSFRVIRIRSFAQRVIRRYITSIGFAPPRVNRSWPFVFVTTLREIKNHPPICCELSLRAGHGSVEQSRGWWMYYGVVITDMYGYQNENHRDGEAGEEDRRLWRHRGSHDRLSADDLHKYSVRP